MTLDLNALRNSRNRDYTKLADKINAAQNQKKVPEEDTRFWKPTRDKTGNGAALIRFLSNPVSEDLPYVAEYSYNFQNKATGRWYIERSPSTIGLPDPVYESNGVLYGTKNPDDEAIAKSRKRNLSYICNVLVISDQQNPENNGKVFLYRFGKKIFDKILAKQNPTFEDQKPVIVWDVFNGAPLRMNIKTISENGRDWPNYDNSEWGDVGPVASSDEAILEILNKMHDIAEFTKPEGFKPYEDLKKRLDWVMGVGGSAPANRPAQSEDDDAPSAAPASIPAAEAPAMASAPAQGFDDWSDDIPF